MNMPFFLFFSFFITELRDVYGRLCNRPKKKEPGHSDSYGPSEIAHDQNNPGLISADIVERRSQ